MRKAPQPDWYRPDYRGLGRGVVAALLWFLVALPWVVALGLLWVRYWLVHGCWLC